MPVPVFPWRRHQMETFSALLAFCAGNSPVTDDNDNKMSNKCRPPHLECASWTNTTDDIFSPQSNDHISWWRHQMETFSALLALCAGNSPVPVNSPHKGQWRGALMFSLICARINDWVNNREAGDLRRHRGHYDVNVIWLRTGDIYKRNCWFR